MVEPKGGKAPILVALTWSQLAQAMADLSGTYRLRALECERRARDAFDPDVIKEWNELAIQWHLMANLSAQESGKPSDIDIV